MIIKDRYGIFHETQIDADIERQLWQSGKVHGGFYNPWEGEQNGCDFQHDLRNKFPGERERRS